MYAAIYEGKKQIQIRECQPVAPGPGEVQIAVSFCGICGTDMHIYDGDLDARVKAPQVIGHEMCGTVSAVGACVKRVREGDQVSVMPLRMCGQCVACRNGFANVCRNLRVLGVDAPGAFQNRWTVPEETVFFVPFHVSARDAALVEPLAVACHDLYMSRLQKGEKTLVIGGGPIGALIGLLAQHDGGEVVVTEVNPARIALLEKAGLKVINPRAVDANAALLEWTSGEGVDLAFEVSGNPAGAAFMTEVLRPHGRIVMVSMWNRKPEVDVHRFFLRELSMVGARVYLPADFSRAIDLIADKALNLNALVTSVTGFSGFADKFAAIASGAPEMKVLLDCSIS
jgi:(R,R)-butanediol dehydrogenase / meso-butanediol dehydrogenase / diacetyl reductase